MKRIAIIGTGIAGMACGYYLSRQNDITVYEKNDYAGGHTNTVMVKEDGRMVPVDTGFMVYNEATYPKLTELFHELKVVTKPTSMSFSVQHVPSGLEFCGSGFSGLFAQRKNLLKPAFWKLLLEIDRFNRIAPDALSSPAAQRMTLREYAKAFGFSDQLLSKYLIPMSSAVWSTPTNKMVDFPVTTLIRFFKNHGFLGLNAQLAWRTVEGGSRAYRDKIVAPFVSSLRLAQAAVEVKRSSGKVQVTDARGRTNEFDGAIIATHADEALMLLVDPTDRERELLAPFKYQRNVATLHTDDSVMPKTRPAWSSWNYRVEAESSDRTIATTIYDMKSLQGASDRQRYFVSINDPGLISPSKVLRTIDYEHPVFSLAAIEAQPKLSSLNENGVTFFCGSYFRYGFHEDALMAALDVVERVKAA